MDAVRAPAAGEGGSTEFKDVQPELSGIGGWLVIVAIGQGYGILVVIAGLFQYTKMDPQILEKFPVTVWGEAALNVGMLALAIYTAVLFWRHSRKFPRFFVYELIVALLLPIIGLVWAALTISLYTGRSFSELVTLESGEVWQIFSSVIAAAIWIPYILRSRRVANTFVK